MRKFLCQKPAGETERRKTGINEILIDDEEDEGRSGRGGEAQAEVQAKVAFLKMLNLLSNGSHQ